MGGSHRDNGNLAVLLTPFSYYTLTFLQNYYPTQGHMKRIQRTTHDRKTSFWEAIAAVARDPVASREQTGHLSLGAFDGFPLSRVSVEFTGEEELQQCMERWNF